jgi:putative two-component system hydrogenase maturation factor HypX/HoxX
MIRNADSQPGVLETLEGIDATMVTGSAFLADKYGLSGETYFLFGALTESLLNGVQEAHAPKTIIGHRNGAILISCGTGAVWISHLRRPNTPSRKNIKLPAVQVLSERVSKELPYLPGPTDLVVETLHYPSTFQEIFIWRENDVAFCWFDFYNGAMSTSQCNRLSAVLGSLNHDVEINVLVFMGGMDFFSNGINLNVIEAADDPSEEAYSNIVAIDNVVSEILLSPKITIAALLGNGGAGGAMMTQAADYVWAHSSIVLNPSYKNMSLFGSEYWTYSLPRRVGSVVADRLANRYKESFALSPHPYLNGVVCLNSSLPVSAKEGLALGLINEIITEGRQGFVEAVLKKVATFDYRRVEDSGPRKKAGLRTLRQKSKFHRQEELKEMHKCFRTEEFHAARQAFVYKYRKQPCVR